MVKEVSKSLDKMIKQVCVPKAKVMWLLNLVLV